MKKNDCLKEIILKKQEKIAAAKQQFFEQELIARSRNQAAARPFIEAINKPRQINLIAEIKKASPSRGMIRHDFDPVGIAKIYAEAGVSAISVLTEEDYFSGSVKYLEEIRAVTELPILRKDFILETYQVYESRAFGADAILLIADLLSRDKLIELTQLADSLGLDCLVEVHTGKELKKVLNLKLPLIGINNRDLHTLEVDFKTTEKLFPMLPKDKTVVVESGIKTRQDILFLKILGVNAVLIGEAFMAAPDIKQKIEELMGW